MKLGWIAAISWSLLASSVAAEGVRAAEEAASPLALVQRAYERTLRAPGVRSVELAVHRGGRLVSRRAFDVAYRRDADSSRSLLRFTAPSYLRGDGLLVVESGSGTSDVWLYQAGERRARRVGSTQHADAFYGSDLSFEELEHPRFDAWQLRRMDGPESSCACDVIEARPARDSQYGRLVLWIDRSRVAIARIDFFRGAEAQPIKRLIVSLDRASERSGYLHVEAMRIEQVGRDAWTEVATVRMEIDPSISGAVFSAGALEREGDDLYALSERHAAIGDAP